MICYGKLASVRDFVYEIDRLLIQTFRRLFTPLRSNFRNTNYFIAFLKSQTISVPFIQIGSTLLARRDNRPTELHLNLYLPTISMNLKIDCQ